MSGLQISELLYSMVERVLRQVFSILVMFIMEHSALVAKSCTEVIKHP